MIKGIGYLKYLKLSLIGLGISFFTTLIGNYVNAEYVPIGSSSTFSDGNICTIYSNLGISCSKSNSILTNKFSTNQYNDSLNGIFWSEDGIGVFYNETGFQNSSYQGLIKDGFHICVGDTSINNLQRFYQGVGSNCQSYGFTSYGNYSYQDLSNKLTREVPIYRGNFTNTSAGVQLMLIYDGRYFSLGIDGYGSTANLNGNYTDFNFGFPLIYTYDNFPFNNSYVRNNPKGKYEPNNTNIVINKQCPTIKELMQNMGSNYNTGLCYNSTKYFNGTSFETISKDNIFTIFNNDYENYTNRISIYWNNCNGASNNQNCANAFSGEFKKLSIISNAINSNVNEKQLWNYCNMGLNYDPNATTCVASGTIKENYTPEERLDGILNAFQGIPTPGKTTTGKNNNVFNALCDENDPDCYTKNNIRDVFGALERIYEKLTGLFKERNNVNGIIPPYILWITFVTILFTIIFKK